MRAGVAKTVVALIFFIAVYMFLLASSVGLLYVCGLAASVLLTQFTHFIFILLAGGLLVVGGMVVFFLVKFLFSKSSSSNAGKVEIFDGTHPKLFALIHDVASQVGTKPPKRTFLSPEVNASVSFDNTFLSMFLPVRKNLTIGLGLVNGLNRSELTAVIAHEFGHFSQKSMRAGSFVYQANRVIYNMLYQNEGFDRTLARIAGLHGILGMAAQLVVRLARGCQWVLRQAYKVVSRQYSALSRQMEFHADSVAAAVAGSEACIHMLRRLEVADAGYDAVVEGYNTWIQSSEKGTNAYTQQRIVMRYIAADADLPLQDSLPLMGEADEHYRNERRVVAKDQWASHPLRSEREAALREMAVPSHLEAAPAWTLFEDADAVQRDMTDMLYGPVVFPNSAVSPVDDAEFEERYRRTRAEALLPVAFGGYYDGRSVAMFDVYEALADPSPIQAVEDFFTGKNEPAQRLNGASSDLELLEAIASGEAELRSFDFDGKKYRRKQAPDVKAVIEADMKAWEAELLRRDREVFRAYAQSGNVHTAALAEWYRGTQGFERIHAENITFCGHLMGLLQPLYTARNYDADGAQKLVAPLREAAAHLFPSRLQKVRDEMTALPRGVEEPYPAAILELKNRSWDFFFGSAFVEKDLEDYKVAIHEFAGWSFGIRFKMFQRLLKLQAGEWCEATADVSRWQRQVAA